MRTTTRGEPKQQFSVRLPLRVVEQLHALCEMEDRELPYFIRKAVDEMLERRATAINQARNPKGRAA